VRDGRAVVHSLLNVPFWRNKGGLERPFWSGLLGVSDLERWQTCARDPAVLAAVQWKRVIELARSEAAALATDRYIEVRYEEFTAAPHDAIGQVLNACGLPDDPAVHRSIDQGPQLRNMNFKFRDELAAESLQRLTSSIEPLLAELGYA